jgi:hypothetical protein
MHFINFLLQRLKSPRILHFGEKKKICPAKVRERFPQNPSRQKGMVSKTDL